MLLVYNETIQEHDAASEESIAKEEEAVLIVRENVVTQHSKHDVRQDNHGHCFEHGAFNKLTDREDDSLHLWHHEGCIFQKRDGANTDNNGVEEHADLVVNVSAAQVNIGCGLIYPY